MNLHTLTRRLFSRALRSRNVATIRKNPLGRPLEALEDRSVPATLTDGGTLLTLTLDNANEAIGIVSNGATYTFTSTNNFADGGVANTGDFTAFGTTSIDLKASGLTRYTAIDIVNTSGVAGTSVAFNDSGANAYSDTFKVRLDSGSGGMTFDGASTFGALDLIAKTDGSLTVNAGASVSNTGGHLIYLQSDVPVLNGTVTAAGAGGEVDVLAFHLAISGSLGSAGAGFDLSQAELDNISASILQVFASADINLAAPITLNPAKVPTLYLNAGFAGAVIDGTAGEQADITVDNLRISSVNGIGAADNLDIAVGKLAFSNAAGAVDISNTGALTIDSVFGLAASTNLGTTTTLTASSPLTVAANVTSAGNLTLTAGESATPAIDNVTVNAGVTVRSTGGNVVLQAGDDILLGVGATVKSDAGSITLTAAFGDLDSEGALNLGAGIIQAGTDITLSARDGIALGALTAGAAGLVSVTSTNGAITDGNDGTTPGTLNITAQRLALSASTGIGATGQVGEIETQVSNVEAQTATGGIVLNNTGALTIGGVTGALTGVRATTSGNISLTNAGSVSVTLGGENIVAQAGNVTVAANGAAADLQTGGKDFSPAAAIRTVASGNITLSAGRDVLLGVPAGPAWGNVRSANDVTLTAGRDLVVDTDSFLESGTTLGAGNVVGVAGRNVSILNNGFPGAHVAALGTGSVSLTTGTGGVFTADNASSPAVFTNGGNITITADNMAIGDGIDAGAGIVTLRQVTNGQLIDLGGADAAGTLGLTDAELDQVIASILRIGDANTGAINVSAAISPAFAATLSLHNNSAITDAAAGSITETNLAIRSTGAVTLDSANTVANLAVSLTGTGTLFFNDGTNALTVGSAIDGLTGITTVNANVTLAADNMDINNAINVGNGATGGRVTLQTFTAIRDIDLGTETAGQLSLTDAELDRVTARVLQIGVGTANNISVTNAMTFGANVPTLSLIVGKTITDTAAGSITVTNLRASGATGVTLDSANDAGIIAGNASTSGDFIYTDNNALTVDTVDGVTGITSAAGNVTLTTNGGNLNLNALITGTTVTLNAGNAITDGNGAANNIAATTLNATAAAGIDLDTAVGSITASNTVAGAILIDELDAVTLTSITAANGPITITTGGATTVTSVVSTTDTDANDISITAATGDITVATVNAGTTAGDVTLTATTGNIFDDGVNGTVITADVLTLTADRSIGQPGATAGMDSTANSLTATTTGAGPFVGAPTPGIWDADTNAIAVTSATTQDGVILLDSAGTMTVGTVNAGGTGRNVRLQTSAGDIAFGAAGSVTAAGDIVRFQAFGAITESGTSVKVTAGSLSASAGTGGFGTAGDPFNTNVTNLVASAAGDVFATNAGALTTANITVFGNTTNGVTSTGGNVGLATAASDLTLTGLVSATTAGKAVTLNAAGAIVDGNAAANNVSSPTLNLTAGTGIDLDSTVSNVNFTNTTNAVNIRNTGALTINAVSTNTGTTTTVKAASPLTIAANVTSAGTLTLTAGETADGPAFADDLTINAGITVRSTGGNVVLQAGDEIVMNATSAAQADVGSVTLTAAFGDLDADGAILMNATSTITAGTDITLSARDTIAVGLLTAGAAGTVTITSTNGAITDANGAANNIAGLNLFASAATGIDLDTAVANITATTTGVGAILIDEANTVTLTSVTAANGPITITTGGATTVTSVVSTTDTDANDISITAATGDITVATVTAGAGVAGDVTLTATTGNIFDDGANATVITADVLTLTADRAIGAPGATAGMDSTANSLVATTTGAGPFAGAPTPGIWVADTDALVVTSATTQDGVILIDAARTAAGNLTVVIVNAGGTGRIVQLRTLTGAASNIDFGAAGTATALADTIRLVSTGAVTESGSANKVIAGSLSIVAAAGIATAADPLNTSVTNLAFQNSTTGAVNVRNNGALTIAAVGTVTPSFNNAAAQPTILAAVGPLTFAVNTTSAGDLTATAIETADAPTFADDLTIDSGITVRSTGGNVLLQAGDDILMNAGSLAQSDLGSATLTAAFGDLDSEGSIAMASASSVTAGTDITLSARDNIAVENLTSGAANAVTLTTTTGAIAENASGRITARTMTTISVHGTQLDSAPNAVSSFNAVNSASGSVSLTNSIPLNVIGIVQTGGGLVAVNNALKLTVSGGVLADTGEIDLIALAGGIDLNTANTKVKTDGTVLLNSVAGDVTESASAQGIIGGSIALQGSGAFLLPNILNDAVRNFRANTSGGTVTFRDANDLTIDPLNGVKTNSNDLTLLVGTNFTSEEGRAGGVLGNAPLVDAGANGNVVILPGLAGPSHFRFASEIFAKTASFGNVVGLSNNGADQFEIRPSTRTRVLSVAGNDPRQVFPGDTINPITDDPSITNVELIQDSNGPEGLAGRYRITYADGSVSTIEFKQIESFGRASFKGIAVQTGARDYAVRLQFLQGSQAVSSAFDLQAIAANPFVVSPSRIDPNQQYSAPSIAFGDVNGDGQLDLVIANGANDAPLVTIFDGRSLIASSGTRPTGTILKQFYAFTDANGLPTFRGGLSVAIRTNGTKPADIVLGPGPGGGPVVQIWGIANNFATPLSSFFAYEAEFRGGVNVAAGDYNGDGKADIIVGAGPGGGPRVRVFDNGDPSRPLLDDFFAYDPSFRGGVLVDAGQFDGNKGDDIVTAPGAGGGPHIKVFSINIPGSPNTRASFFAWDVNQSNGLQSLGANANNGIGSISFGAIEGRFNPADNTFSKGIPDPKGRQEILASSARGAPLQMRRFQFANASAVSFTAFTDLFADLTAGAPLTDPATKAPLAESQLSEGGSVAGALPSS